MENSSTFSVVPRLAGEGVVEIKVSGKFSGDKTEKHRIKQVLNYAICKVAKVLHLKGGCDELHKFVSEHASDKQVEKIAA